ncbi:DET1 homolog [Trichogramma pretiosum]|uniref:DET1 homolog n=1 Tax=Trichogramma pretiosum TaxID=7493 RepID=UPI0006C98DAF|nr:DET1 homolog [Trichogramma pretiosum]
MMNKSKADIVKEACPIQARKIGPQNIVLRLRRRETLGCLHPGTHVHTARQFYQNIFPNYTVVNVEKPPCFLRKFSPDGKYLVAFSADQSSLEIYEYQGAGAAGDMLVGCKDDYIGNKNDPKSFDLRNFIFRKFFKIKWVVNIVQSNEQLNRECSLFTDDSRYVIVGSAAFIADEVRPHFYQIYTNNEALCPNPRAPLEDISIHLVDIKNGKLCDTKQFKIDKIYLSQNQGVYLYKDTLAVLSVQHQTIHMFQLIDGMFINIRKIGRFCLEDDAFILSLGWPRHNTRPVRDATISSLKHKLLVFLYNRASYLSHVSHNPYELRKFYQHFDQLKSLKMWKMQLLDTDHILIRYASEDVATLQATEPNSQPALIVIYNMSSAKIIAVHDNASRDLLMHFENFTDCFRNTRVGNADGQYVCSPSNNIYARLIQQRLKQTFISARYGGITEATKRLLAQLPICAQSYSTSPYLDLSLFSYDDKWISMLERPKTCSEHPIRFYARDSGILKFKLHATVPSRANNGTHARKLVAFTFHPTDPFAISVQRTSAEYIVSFHVRHDHT